MTQPAHVPAPKPASDTLTPSVPLRLKPLTGRLPIFAGFLYSVVAQGLFPRRSGAELCRRISRCFAKAATFRVPDALVTQLLLSCARALPCTDRTEVYGFSAAPKPAWAGRTCTTHRCEACNRASVAQRSCFPRRRFTRRHP